MVARITLTVDVEGDWYGLPGEQASFNLDKVLFAVLNLEKLLNQVESKLMAPIPVTWFVRCDDSVAAMTGEQQGLLYFLDEFIQRRLERGDEFGFHPHLYCFDQNTWFSETNVERQREQLYRSADGWKRYFGVLPRISRMGEAVMNNVIAETLDLLGIEIDSSALPSRVRFDNGFHFDWAGTPYSSYYPSIKDYRIPASDGGLSRKFIEAPFAMFPVKAAHDQVPIMRYCNLAFKPVFFGDALRKMDINEKLITVMHPHELLVREDEHPLIAYDSRALYENMQNLKDVFGDLSFHTLSKSI